jgi:hypothetical protein
MVLSRIWCAPSSTCPVFSPLPVLPMGGPSWLLTPVLTPGSVHLLLLKLSSSNHIPSLTTLSASQFDLFCISVCCKPYPSGGRNCPDSTPSSLPQGLAGRMAHRKGSIPLCWLLFSEPMLVQVVAVLHTLTAKRRGNAFQGLKPVHSL